MLIFEPGKQIVYRSTPPPPRQEKWLQKTSAVGRLPLHSQCHDFEPRKAGGVDSPKCWNLSRGSLSDLPNAQYWPSGSTFESFWLLMVLKALIKARCDGGYSLRETSVRLTVSLDRALEAIRSRTSSGRLLRTILIIIYGKKKKNIKYVTRYSSI